MTYDEFFRWRQRWAAIRDLIIQKQKTYAPADSMYSTLFRLEAYIVNVRETIGLMRAYTSLVWISPDRQVLEAVISGSDDLNLLLEIVDYILGLNRAELNEQANDRDF